MIFKIISIWKALFICLGSQQLLKAYRVLGAVLSAFHGLVPFTSILDSGSECRSGEGLRAFQS